MAKLYASIRTQSLDEHVLSRTISACPALEDRDDIVHA
jgi:hypothetical protein